MRLQSLVMQLCPKHHLTPQPAIRLCPVSGHDDSQETSSKSEPSHKEEDAHSKDEDAETDMGDAEVLSDGQAASDGDEGQGHTPIQNTLTGVSHIFGTHEETDAESDTKEKVQSTQQKQCQPSLKEDMPSKESSKSSSEEEQPTDKALRDKAWQWARQLDTNFDAWWCKKIAKGVAGWAMRDTMICQAVAEVIVATRVPPRSPPKRMARLPLPIPRAQAPLLPLSPCHAAVDRRPPTTTSPTRRTQVRSERKRTM